MRGKKIKQRIAIFHDFFGSIGGGEKLVLELAKGLKADIITTEHDKKNLKRMDAGSVNIISLGNLVQLPIFKQIEASIKFHKAKCYDKYDFFIMSGNWAIFAAKKHRPNLYYMHTPVRMFYDGKDFFYKIAPWWAKWPFLIWVAVHKWFVEQQFKYVDKIVANSRNVQRRIWKYHHQRSVIVNPPIKQYKFIKYGDYWLAVTRLYPHKRIELLFDVFRQLPEEKLIIVGGRMKGDHSQMYIKSIINKKPDNVRIIGEVTEEKLAKLYGECKAFITLSKDEDFGMTVLEANSAGKPVIATDEGGHRETIINGKTGWLVKAATNEVVKTITKLSNNSSKYKNSCQDNASKYSVSKFITYMRSEIED